VNANGDQGVTDVLELEWLDNRHNDFHGSIELCVNLGDVADQASWLCLVWTTSMPSENLTPATIFGN
jgi:hypothetical protein